MNWPVLLLVLFVSISSNAKDLGNFGNTYEIKERDLEEYIISSLAGMGEDKLLAHQKKIAAKIVKNIKRPTPVPGITSATENLIRYFDPSFTVERDIYDHQYRLLHAKGKIVNPLKHQDFQEIWLMINSDEAKELEFAKTYLKQHVQETKNKEIKGIKIILVKGAPGEQEDGSFYYFDQFGEISKKLNITKTPSIIRQAANTKLIEIEEVAL